MTDAPTALWLKSRAKLNLRLSVTGRRSDGYHLLDTVYHQLDLHDDVVVRLTSENVTVGVTADEARLLVPADDRNLAAQALRRFAEAVSPSCGFHVDIHKRIPNGGGLGGGSSNAAATLRLANALLGAPLAEESVAEVARGLGADVPFFLVGGSQRGQGIGDELTPLAVPARFFVLILPPFGCATAEVYKNYARRLAAGLATDTLPRNQVSEDQRSGMASALYNQLEQAAEDLCPELGRLRRSIVDSGYEQVRMTGSGSTLFVAWDSEAEALRCRQDLERKLRANEHHDVGLLVTRSAGGAGVELPSAELPVTVRRSPPA